MNRDFWEIQNYKGTKETNPGAIIVPEVHVSSKPRAAYDPKKDPEIVKVIKNFNPIRITKLWFLETFHF